MSYSKLFLLLFILTASVTAAGISQQYAWYINEQASSNLALTAGFNKYCVSASLQNQPLVNGLDHSVKIPSFPGAQRLSYADSGASQYLAKAADYEILGFYQERMSSLCWQIKAQSHNQVVFDKDDKQVRIALLTNPISRTVINYEILSANQVLGKATVRIAQNSETAPPPVDPNTSQPPPPTTPPPSSPPPDSSSCGSGMVWCPSSSGSGGWCQTPPCPSSTPPPSSSSCSGGQVWCTDSSGGGWCQMPPCPSATPSTGSSSCSGGQIWCSSTSGSGGWCQMPPCPSSSTGSSSCSGGQVWCQSSSSSGGWCQYPPCPSSSPSTTTCSGSYQQPNISYPSCNSGTCPSGCTWGADGCPSGCYTSPSCSGEFQQPGSSYPSCNYSRCPSGCMWDSTGCPSACQVSCPAGQYSCNGACISNSTSCYGTGSTSNCPSGQYWCNGACIANSSYCNPTSSASSGYYATQTACETAGGRWCQPTTSPHCHGPSDQAPCEADTPGGGYYASCSSTQYMCNGVCVNMNTPCNPTTYPTDSASCAASGKVWCVSSSGGSGWCQLPPCPSQNSTNCASGSYYCSTTYSCLPSNSTCPSSPTTSGTTCATGFYWCPQTSSCLSNSQPCSTTSPSQPTPTPAVQCGQCQVSKSGKCVKAPVGTLDPFCNGGQCDQYGGCVQLIGNRRLVGEGAICGDRWCNVDKGENKENCPGECTNEPKRTQVAPTTQFPSGQTQPMQNQQQYPNQGQQNQGPYRGESFSGFSGEQNRGENMMNEEEQRQAQEQQFKMMKKGIDQFTRGVKDMQKYISKIKTKLTRAGVSIPPELANALNKAPELVTKFKNAKSLEEVEELMADMEDIALVMQDWGPRLGDLERLADMLKQTDQQIKKTQSALKRLQIAAKRRAELAEPLKELETLFNELKTLAADAKVLAKTDPDSALEKIDEFFGNMEEYWNQVSFVDMITNMQKGLASAKSQLAAAERRLKALERTKKIDAETLADLKNLLVEVKAKLPELQTLMKQKPIDYETIQVLGEELWDNVQMFENTMASYGQSYYLPVIKGGGGVKFEAPQGFISPPSQSETAPEAENQPR